MGGRGGGRVEVPGLEVSMVICALMLNGVRTVSVKFKASIAPSSVVVWSFAMLWCSYYSWKCMAVQETLMKF